MHGFLLHTAIASQVQLEIIIKILVGRNVIDFELSHPLEPLDALYSFGKVFNAANSLYDQNLRGLYRQRFAESQLCGL